MPSIANPALGKFIAVADYLATLTGVEEVEPSPKISFSRTSGEATRYYRVQMNTSLGTGILGDIFQNLLPPPVISGNGEQLQAAPTFPGVPRLYVANVNFEPWEKDTIRAAGTIPGQFPAFQAMRCTVAYKTREYNQNGKDNTGPGGNQGSTGDPKNSTFVSHKVSIGGEFLTVPSAGLQWGTFGDISLTGAVPARQNSVDHNVQVGIVVPTIEHAITWHNVISPPWLGMRQCLGNTNAYSFAGCPPGTCLFLGGDCSREITASGPTTWTMNWKFSEKRPGWSYFIRPDGAYAGSYQLLQRRAPGGESFLTANINNSVTSMALQNVGNLPASGAYCVQVDDEQMFVTAGASPVTIVRGVNGTSAASHNSGALVKQVFSGQLQGDISSTAITLYWTVNSVLQAQDGNFLPLAVFPTTAPTITLQVDDEQISVYDIQLVSVSPSVYKLTCLRGVNGTAADDHSDETTMFVVASPVYGQSDFRVLFTPAFNPSYVVPVLT